LIAQIELPVNELARTDKAACEQAALFELIADSIERQGYVILPDSLPESVAEALLECLSRVQSTAFQPATIGRGTDQMHNQFVRRDNICWLEESTPYAASWFDWAGALQSYLNRRLFLGLFSFESHFSRYQPGDFYRRHVDAFKGESNRVLSVVTYLNRGWEPDQGGELVLYPESASTDSITVQPGFRTLVMFLSEEMPHEVLPTTRERFAVAGWFRINNSVQGNLDPPR